MKVKDPKMNKKSRKNEKERQERQKEREQQQQEEENEERDGEREYHTKKRTAKGDQVEGKRNAKSRWTITKTRAFSEGETFQ